MRSGLRRRRRRAENGHSGPWLEKSCRESLPPGRLPRRPVSACVTLVHGTRATTADLTAATARTLGHIRPTPRHLGTSVQSSQRRRTPLPDDEDGQRAHTTLAATHALRAAPPFGPRPPAVTPTARRVCTHGGPSWLRNRHVSATATQHPAEVPRGAPPRRGALPSDGPIIYVMLTRM